MTLVGWTCALTIGQLAVAEQEWSFEVVPYLWVAGIELETSLPNLPPSTPNVDRFDTRISAGAMLAAQARYRSTGRYLHEEYDRGSFAFNLDSHGALAGFGFHF